MAARTFTRPALLVLIVLVVLALGVLASPAYAPPPSSAPVRVVDGDDPSQSAAVEADGSLRVAGEVAVSGLPDTVDVEVTNSSSDPVPVRPAYGRDDVTLNTSEFVVPPGGSETFDPEGSFQPLMVHLVQVTGADEDVWISFGESNATRLVLRGEGASGIGQEDHTIALTHPMYVSQVTVRCVDSVPCHLFVMVQGTW